MDGQIQTNGGRVLGVTAWCDTLEGAISAAYEAVDRITFEGCFCRRDIGAMALGIGDDYTDPELCSQCGGDIGAVASAVNAEADGISGPDVLQARAHGVAQQRHRDIVVVGARLGKVDWNDDARFAAQGGGSGSR